MQSELGCVIVHAKKRLRQGSQKGKDMMTVNRFSYLNNGHLDAMIKDEHDHSVVLVHSFKDKGKREHCLYRDLYRM